MDRPQPALSPDSGLLEGLVATKLLAPAPDLRAITRDALIAQQVDETQDHKVLEIVAPAGSGKSTLMAQLHAALTERHMATGWLSLDAQDNDPATFAIYFLSALNSLEAHFAQDELLALKTNPLRDFDALFDRLVRRLSGLSARGALFLDDFQHIDDSRILRFLNELIAHLPDTLRLVIASRSKLPLQLARLNVSGGLAEIGQEELNFSGSQIGQFLERYHEIELAPDDIEALLASTEGWPAGVQLAALALRKHRGAAADLISTFSGRDADLTRYLVETVIRAQPEPVRTFLLRTAPLRRMCADLCCATTGQPEGGRLLRYVGNANLFLIALDREGTWFRYHHLFAEFLQSELRRIDPEEYHRSCYRAAKWCEANGQPAEAIRYALDAEYFSEAAEMIARHAIRASLYHGDHYTVLDWIRRLPAQFRQRRPEILLSHAWSCAFSRDTAHAMEISEQLLTALGSEPAWGMTESERKRTELWALNVQAATRACADDIEDCLTRAKALLPRVPQSEPFLLATLSNCLSYGYFAKRDFERSRQAAMTAHDCGHRADAAYLSAWGDFLHGLIDIELGRLVEAERFGQRVREGSQGLGLGQKSYVAGLAALLEAEIAIQRGEFARASKCIEIGSAFKDIFGPVEPLLVAVRNEARLLAHNGHLDAARLVLQHGQDAALREEQRRLYLALALEEASLQLTAGDLGGALETAQKSGLRANSPSNPDSLGLFRAQRDSLRLLEARFRIAEDEPTAAARILTQLQQRRGTQICGGFLLTVTATRAVALWNLGRRQESARQLDYALECAATEFHAYPIASVGRSLRPILDWILARRPDVESVSLQKKWALQAWLAAHLRGELPAAQPGAVASNITAGEVTERLTPRELRLLRLLHSGLDNRQMAAVLLVSEATVKWHLHNLYSKLGARNRSAAVARATQRGLL